MSDDRDQAIKDVAEHSKYSEEQVRLKVNNALYWPLTEYAVAQRERVIALERALRDARKMIFHQNLKWDLDKHKAIHIPGCPGCKLEKSIDAALGDH